ncbi:hypothetical protein SERLA73DRAFT_48459 [Serpula lacrymans var. lacrymans S7.3]|uniref:Uncharacterized protein n=1 Tax=Serpula lacrymans var. lacrymans (strain S7.3) TaxID=936435 RepID=F8PNN4_SERL3|nr:hypothetical protein SERLA73DRAFT_48459 [Serpula lacrymans var. lacrymans S7.3]
MSRLFPPAGPVLPPFRTILIQGQYHASAPIHLCLSTVTPETSAIILSPSREALVRSLQGYNDEWINNHSGHGSISSMSANIRML